MADIFPDERRVTLDTDVVDLDQGSAEPADPNVVELRDEDADEGLPAHAVEAPDGSIRLPLQHPVTLKFKRGSEVREETFAELVFHRLTGADMRVIKAAKPDAIAPVALARSTRIHEGKMNAVYDRMDARDTTDADRVIMHFLGGGRPTGR